MPRSPLRVFKRGQQFCVPLGGSVLGAQSSSAATGNYAVAPYVDMSNSQETLLNTAITNKGLKASSTANGTVLDVATCNGSSAQAFKLVQES